jgi:hypothetical protein
MKKYVLLLIPFLILCTTFVKAQISIEKNQIAPSFANFNSTLLIVKLCKANGEQSNYTKTINNITEKRFKKFYEGEFEMIEPDDLESGQYKNVKKYPIVIKLTSGGSVGASTYFKFVMTDRNTNSTYDSPFVPSNTIPQYAGINSYAKALEDLRLK